jgi:hypothetical protein
MENFLGIFRGTESITMGFKKDKSYSDMTFLLTKWLAENWQNNFTDNAVGNI